MLSFFSHPRSLKRENEYQTNPRQTALEAILEYYSDKPQTLELLKAISKSDPDEKLKEFAKEPKPILQKKMGRKSILPISKNAKLRLNSK
jgi:hypothetical protein